MSAATARILALSGCLIIAAGCERPPVHAVQAGYRGTGMMQVTNPRSARQIVTNNVPPEALPTVPPGNDEPKARDTFKNVQVLGDLSVAEFARIMSAITIWVAPTQGCTYCHSGVDLASDNVYTKVVARRMIQMTRHINSDWHQHVGATGVTCFTCHRGSPVPAFVWHEQPADTHSAFGAGNRAGQNAPSPVVRLTALPNNPFSSFLESNNNVRVISREALRSDGPGSSIKDVEKTYGLMMHFTQALGVNCVYCHNSRSFFDWDQSTPQRVTAYYGIRMVRDLNSSYLEPLHKTFPAIRLGPLGDSPKLNCTTCHQGAYKPLNGANMLKDYPELAGVH